MTKTKKELRLRPRIGQEVRCVKAFCDGDKDEVEIGEQGIIYNMDDYPRFIYADFENHKGIAISSKEWLENIEVIEEEP